MTKTKIPVLSLGASGTLGDALTFQKRGGTKFVRTKPTPTDPLTLPQFYQRWRYQDYVAWWNAQTAATKIQWESDARRYQMTGFAYWMRQRMRLLPDLVAGWHLDEHGGATARDFSKNTNDGIVHGAIIVPGTIDRARYFDGVDDLINCGNDSSLDLTGDQVTLCAIVTPLPQVGGLLFRHIVRKPTNEYGFVINRDLTNCRFVIKVGGAEKESGAAILTAAFTHRLIGVYNGAYLSLFLDTVEYRGAAQAGNIDSGLASPLLMGNVIGLNRGYKGTIDEVRLYDRAWAFPDIERFQGKEYPL